MEIERALQLAELDLLLELNRICEKQGIKYFLIGGSLIGAVRHAGFIPWDDDVDVGMLREDFSRFREACKTELNSPYYFSDWWIDNASPLAFGKLKIRGTKINEGISSESDISSEIFIDIFPLDVAPKEKILQLVHEISTIVLRKIMLIRCRYRLSEQRTGIHRKINKFIYKMLELLFLPMSTERIKRLYEKNEVRYRNKSADFLVNLNGAYSYKRELKRKDYFTEAKRMKFEGYLLPVPAEFHNYLSEVYGNYMELPPEGNRKPRHNKGIDLGEYTIRNINLNVKEKSEL